MSDFSQSPSQARQPAQMIVLAIERESTERGEVAYAMSHMWNMVATPEAMREHVHCLSLVFQGYDADPRELYEIPEVRAYVQKLMALCPWLALLLSKWDGAIFQLLPALMCGTTMLERTTTRVSVEVDRRETSQLAMRCIKGAGAHLHQLGLPQAEAELLLNELVTEIAKAW